MKLRSPIRSLVCLVVVLVMVTSGFARKTSKSRSSSKTKITESASAQKKLAKRNSRPTAGKKVSKKSSRKRKSARRSRRYVEKFYTSSYAEDITEGDITTGEDPIVRQAALEALGRMNGTVVAVDPTSGRILAMVNQKLALSEGAQPCSTIKVAVGLAALSEGIVSKDTPVKLGQPIFRGAGPADGI
jgi:penicillin-binding protein 2